MKTKDLAKSRTLTFNAIVGAGVPLFNHLFPQIALTAELTTNVLVLGNMLLRFMTDKAVGKE